MTDSDLIKKARQFAEIAHSGQKRASGEPFVTHVSAVSEILSDWKMDTYSIVAGLLHDSVKDGAATKEDLQKEFGATIASLVDGVARVGEIRLRWSSDEEFVENLRKMFLAMAQDLRVVIIKLAD